MIALIPARSGSKRVPGKNVRMMGGHRLIAYTIASCKQAGVFEKVVVSTDSHWYREIATSYGADVVMRPELMARDDSPDFHWVRYTLLQLLEDDVRTDSFAIVRPTSPFRGPDVIRDFYSKFDFRCHSMRMVTKAEKHPAKMWRIRDGYLLPLLPFEDGQPWHSKGTNTLPEVYVQTAGLEMAWTKCVYEFCNISGSIIRPYVVDGWTAFDLNTEIDWLVAEAAVTQGLAKLPTV